jgi:hypothetical protein
MDNNVFDESDLDTFTDKDVFTLNVIGFRGRIPPLYRLKPPHINPFLTVDNGGIPLRRLVRVLRRLGLRLGN